MPIYPIHTIWTLTPRPVIGILAGLLGPSINAWMTGYYRSCLTRTAKDRHGRPIPWFAYPAIEALSDWDVRGLNILEWGAGHSTLWWSSRGAQVVALETNRAWAERIAHRLPSGSSVHRIQSLHDGVSAASESAPFDVIVVDGDQGHRQGAAEAAPGMLRGDGALIVDNNNRLNQHLLDAALRADGFLRIDYYGTSPANVRQNCTSIYCKPECRFLRHGRPPHAPMDWSARRTPDEP